VVTTLNFFQLCYTDILFTEQEVSVFWEIRFLPTPDPPVIVL
jgi:hypothetical protein